MTHHHTLARTVSRPSAVAAMFLLFTAACSVRQAARTPVSLPQQVGAASTPSSTETPAPGQAFGRLLIRRAQMQLEVENAVGISTRVGDVVARLGGYVERSRESSAGGVEMTVRVPEPSLERAMEAVGELGRIMRRDISADDVTERVVDLTARVGTLRAIRDRLRGLLERAGSINEIITVERELARVQSELDALEQRLEFLRGNASLAELTVEARRKRILGPVSALLVGAGRLLGKLFVIR